MPVRKRYGSKAKQSGRNSNNLDVSQAPDSDPDGSGSSIERRQKVLDNEMFDPPPDDMRRILEETHITSKTGKGAVIF